jgi:hypothetical protein
LAYFTRLVHPDLRFKKRIAVVISSNALLPVRHSSELTTSIFSAIYKYTCFHVFCSADGFRRCVIQFFLCIFICPSLRRNRTQVRSGALSDKTLLMNASNHSSHIWFWPVLASDGHDCRQIMSHSPSNLVRLK